VPHVMLRFTLPQWYTYSTSLLPLHSHSHLKRESVHPEVPQWVPIGIYIGVLCSLCLWIGYRGARCGITLFL